MTTRHPPWRHVAILLIAMPLVLAACGDGDAEDTTTTVGETTTTTEDTTTTSSTTSTSTSTTLVETTTTLVTTDATYAVVLVADDDILNVREEPLGDIIGTLEPNAIGLVPTGATETLDDGDLWRELITDEGTGWANAFYLAEEIGVEVFDADDKPEELVDAFVDWAEDGEGPTWQELVGPKGFSVVHFDEPRNWDPADNPFLDDTVYDWGGEATGPDQPVDQNSFADQVGDSFLGVIGDDDLETAVGETLQGQEPGPPYTPIEFENFDFIAYHDPGDDPDVEGLDWTTWYVYFDWTGDEWTLVGMSIDRYAP